MPLLPTKGSGRWRPTGAALLLSGTLALAPAAATATATATWTWGTVGVSGGASEYLLLSAVSALPDGSVIAAGIFGLAGGSATFGELSLDAVGDDEVLVVKVDATGEPVWVNRAGPAPGTTGTAQAFGVSAGAADGSAIVVGYFTGDTRFGSTDLSSASSSAADVFVAKVNADGDWVWAVEAGGSEPDLAFDVSMLPDGSAIIAGRFDESVTFGATTLTATSVGSHDAFVAKVNANGTWAWAVKAGGGRV